MAIGDKNLSVDVRAHERAAADASAKLGYLGTLLAAAVAEHGPLVIPHFRIGEQHSPKLRIVSVEGAVRVELEA